MKGEFQKMTEQELLQKVLTDIELMKIDIEMLIHNESVRNDDLASKRVEIVMDKKEVKKDVFDLLDDDVLHLYNCGDEDLKNRK